MYVERLTPATGARHRYPIIFIHGQAQTGTVRRSILAQQSPRILRMICNSTNSEPSRTGSILLMAAKGGLLGSYRKATRSTSLTSLNVADRHGFQVKGQWRLILLRLCNCSLPRHGSTRNGRKLIFTHNGRENVSRTSKVVSIRLIISRRASWGIQFLTASLLPKSNFRAMW